jgi:hypothetical protein
MMIARPSRSERRSRRTVRLGPARLIVSRSRSRSSRQPRRAAERLDDWRPKLADIGIATVRPRRDGAVAGEIEMHARHRNSVNRNHIKHPPPRRGRRLAVEIIDHARLRNCELDARQMNQVAPDEQLVVSGRDSPSRVPRRVSRRRDCEHVWGGFPLPHRAQSISVGREDSGCENKIRFLTLAQQSDVALFAPKLQLVLVHDKFGPREDRRSRSIDQAGVMIGVQMRHQDGVDVDGLDP